MFTRVLPIPYEMARTELEPVLSSKLFRFVRETYDHESFGSAYAEYRKGDIWLRLVWDGKDQWLSMDIARPAARPPSLSDWHDLEHDLDGRPKHVSQPGPLLVSPRISELRHALDRLIAIGYAPKP